MLMTGKYLGVRYIGLAASLATIVLGAWFGFGSTARPCGANMRAEEPAERVFELKIEHGALSEDKRSLRVTQGDTVRLRWSVDKPTVLHLHGYDIEKKAAPGEVTEFRFTAHATGRFPVNIHSHGSSHHDEPLMVLEVYPR